MYFYVRKQRRPEKTERLALCLRMNVSSMRKFAHQAKRMRMMRIQQLRNAGVFLPHQRSYARQCKFQPVGRRREGLENSMLNCAWRAGGQVQAKSHRRS